VKSLGVESRGDSDPTSIGKDQFETGLGGIGRRGGLGKDGDGEKMVGSTGGSAIIAEGGFRWVRLIEVISEGVKRDLALAAELGLS